MKLKRILMLCVAVCATGPVLGMTGRLYRALDGEEDLPKVAERFKSSGELSAEDKELLNPERADVALRNFFYGKWSKLKGS